MIAIRSDAPAAGRAPFSVVRLALVALLLMAVSAAGLAASAPDPVGRVTVTLGTVEAQAADGTTRTLRRQDPVFEGDTLRTGPRGRAQVRFTDRGLMSLRPDTELVIDGYAFTAPAAASAPGSAAGAGTVRQELSLNRGGFRAMTGRIADANRSAYRVRTPLAVIGVRGTIWDALQVVGGPLLLGAAQGGIEALSSAGNNAVIGEGAAYNYARVNPDGSIDYLIEAPSQLDLSPELDETTEEEQESGDLGEAEDSSVATGGGDAESTVGAPDAGGLAIDTANDPESTGTIARSNTGTGEQPTEFGGVLSAADRAALLADTRAAIVAGVASDAVDGSGEFLLGSDRIGVGSGLGTLDANGRPLLAGALGLSGFDEAFLTLGRADLLDLANAFLTRDSGPASGLFPNGTFDPLEGAAGVTWGSFMQPVRIFRNGSDATDFLTTIGTSEVLFALGTPTDIASLSGFRSYELADSRVVTTGGLRANGVFAVAFLDLGTGELDGILDLNLAEEGTPTTTRYEYVVDYNALVRGGLLTNVNVIFAELFDQQIGTGQFAEAELTGFLTGADAEFLNLAFSYHVPGNTLFDASGLALLMAEAEDLTPPNALTLEEIAALDAGIGFVAAECCFFATDGTIAGVSTDPRPSMGLDALLGVNLAEGVLDPAFNGFPPDAVFRRQSAGTANYRLFEGNGAIAGFEWQGFVGGPVGIFDSATGAALDEITGNLLVLTGPMASVAELTGGGRFSTRSFEQGFLSSSSGLFEARVLDGVDISFNVDFNSGEIFGGQALVFTAPVVEGESFFFRDGFDVGFDGQVGTSNANPFVDFRILGGIYFDENADAGGFGTIDLERSSLAGFFVAGGNEFNMAFNFVTAESTFDDGSELSPGFEFIEPVSAVGLAVLRREMLQLTPAELASFQQGRVFIGAGCCFGADGLLDGGAGAGLATEALIDGIAVGPVLGVNVDALGDDIAPFENGFATLPPDRLFRLGGAEQNPGFVFFLPPPGAISTLEQYEWDGFGTRALEVDAATGDVIGELNEQLLFQTVMPVDVALLTGLRFYGGSTLTGNIGGAAIVGDAVLGESFGQAFDFGVSFAIDFNTGDISQGHLFVQPDFSFPDEPAPLFSAFFGGRMRTDQDSPFIDVTITDGSYNGIVPLDLEASEIAGVFVQDAATYLAGSFFLATDEVNPIATAGIFTVAGQQDQRFLLQDVQALDRVGIAALANRDISGNRALLPNLLLGRASAVVEGATPSFQLAANRLRVDSGFGALGPSRPGFFDLPVEFRLDQFFAEDAPLFVNNVVPTGGPVFAPELQISWGAWNAGVEFEARLQDDPGSTNGTNLLERVFFASVNPTPTALMPASGVFTYAGSTGNDNIAQLGAGGGDISLSLQADVIAVAANFIVDFGSGAISDGLLQVTVPGSQTIRWDGQFSGRVQGAIADLQLDALSITEVSGFTVIGQGLLEESSITGLFTGPNGERFLGGYSFDADVPLGGVEGVRGLFVIDGTPGLLPGG